MKQFRTVKSTSYPMFDDMVERLLNEGFEMVSATSFTNPDFTEAKYKGDVPNIVYIGFLIKKGEE